jgi:hypothetical protein
MSVVLNGVDPFHLVFAGENNDGVIANRDTKATVLLGPDQGSLYRSDPNISIVDPLGAIPVDGKRDYWAIVDSSQASPGAVASLSAEVDYIPGATGWSPAPSAIAQVIAPLSAAIAQQIFATGIPVVPDPTVIYNL